MNALLFLYFFTLHADQLSFPIAGCTVRLNNLIALFVLSLYLIRFRFQIIRINRRLVFAFIFLTCSIVISLLLSPYKKRCLIFLGWYGFMLLCYVFLPYILMKCEERETIFSLYLLSFICVGLYALFQFSLSFIGFQDPFATQCFYSHFVRANAFAYEPSYYALYMTPFIMMCNFHYLSSPETPFFFLKKITWKHLVFFNLLFFVSISTSTVFAYSIFFLCLLFTSSFKQYKKRVFLFVCGFLVMGGSLGIASPYIMKDFFIKFFFHGFMSHHSFYERWVGIENGWKVFLSYPLFGVGLGGYPLLLMDAWTTGDSTFATIPYWFVQRDLTQLIKLFEPMNIFTEVVASLGLVGIGAFGYLIFVFYSTAKKAKEQYPLASNFIVSFIVMLVVLQISQGLFRSYIWVHFIMTFSLIETMSSSNSFSLARELR